MPSDVELPPLVTVFGHPRIGVMIVVPTLAVSDDGDKPVVAAVIGGFIVAITPDVGRTVDHPSRVQDGNQANKQSPNQE